MHAQSSSTNLESEAKEHEVARPKMTTASVEIANISQQHAAFIVKSSFQYCARHSQCEKGAAAQTPSITSSEEGEADILEDMVDQLPAVPGTSNCGHQKVRFQGTNMRGIQPNGRGQCSSKNRDVLCGIPEPIIPAEAPVYHPGPRPVLKAKKVLELD